MHYTSKIELLVQALNDWYKEESYPPECAEIDNVTFVAKQHLGDYRWGTRYEWIFQWADDEVFAAVSDVEPATEYQDWGDYGAPDIYPVKAHEVTTIKYIKE